MKARLVILPVVVLIGVGVSAWQVELIPPAVAGGDVVAAAAMALLPAPSDKAEFVGSGKCKKCHIKQYKSWDEKKKAKAFDLLKPGASAEAKTKAKLDPNKDYTTDAACLKCHTTGFGQPGGYATPDPKNEEAVKEAAKLEGVGCESCHGAGSAYMTLHEEIKKSKRTYKDEEMYAAGVTKIEEPVCTKCHNQESPTYKPLDFEKQKNEGSHEMIPLEQREK